MNRPKAAYAGVLLLLIVTSILLNRNVILGVHNPGDVTLSSDESQYILGQTIVFTGTLDFAPDELAGISAVRLVNVTGTPQALDVLLPAADTSGQFVDLSTQVPGGLEVKVPLTDVTPEGGTLPSGTLPGILPDTSLPDGGNFRGDATTGGRITYVVRWTPPVFLDPPPVFTLIPVTDELFDIQQLAGPPLQTGTVLPTTTVKFTIPVVGQPTGTVLPNVTSTFNIPQPTIITNAPGQVPTLPFTIFDTTTPLGNFNIPDLTALGFVETSSVPSFPDSTSTFDIPTTTPETPPAGVPLLREAALAFAVTTTPPAVRGLGTDGANFWAILDNAGAGGVDRLIKFAHPNTTDATTTLQIIDGPGGDLEGVAFLNGFLWVLENGFRCDDADTANGGKTVNIITTPDTFDRMGGLAGEGSGASGTLWIANEFGFRLYNIGQNGSSLGSFDVDRFVPRMNGIAFSADLLYTIDDAGTRVSQWTDQGRFVQNFDIVKEGTADPVPGINGMTFKTVDGKPVLFLAGSDGNAYQTFFAVTTDFSSPRGVTFSPESSAVGGALWVLVDGSPKDQILKVSTSTGSLITTFSSDGLADAPSGNTEGMTFFDGALWIISNEGDQRKLYKVSASTGAVLATIDLQFTASIFDDLGGITNDGTNLIVHTKSFFNDLIVLDTNGNQVERGFPCCPSFSGARGLTFHSGRERFFAIRGNTIVQYNTAFELSRSFLATEVTSRPRGIAFTPESSSPGAALWILVDGTPSDKLLKVATSTGDLISTFGTNGAVDAPSAATEGITFLDTGTPSTSFLWIVANLPGDAPRLFKVNANTGALAQTLNLGATANIFDELGGITNDGTNLVVFFKQFNDFARIDTNGQLIQRGFACCPVQTFGATGFGRHSSRDQFFAVKGKLLTTYRSDFSDIVGTEQPLRVDGLIAPIDVQGLVFDQDVLFVASISSTQGIVSVGAVRDTVTTVPKGLAFSPAGSALLGTPIGEALWVLVDGLPNDKILKLTTNTGQLITSFGTNGAVDAPSATTEDITFLDGHLWVIDGLQERLYQIQATDGALVQTFDIFFGRMGGITNDGVDLLLFPSDFNSAFVFDTAGFLIQESFFGGPFPEGHRAAALRAGANQVLLARNDRIRQYAIEDGQLFLADEFDTPLVNIQGMAFDVGIAGDVTDDVLFIAHDNAGKISRTAVPSSITNRPQGLAYDPNADELYILVDGKGEANDHIVVVNTSTGAVIRDFEAPDDDAFAITIFNDLLFVSIRDQDFCCPPPEAVRLDKNDGTELQRFPLPDFGRWSGLANDGSALIAAPEFGGPHVEFFDNANGNHLQDVFFFDPLVPDLFVEDFQALAFDTTTEEFFPVKGKDVFRFDADGRKIGVFTLNDPSVGPVTGAVFVGDALYLAEINGNTVHAGLIPVPPTVISTDPVGMATDGTDLYIAVDATPRDKIMKVDTTGAKVAAFGDNGAVDSPGEETDGLAFHKGSLYAAANDIRTFTLFDPFGNPFIETRLIPTISKMNPTTGKELERRAIWVQGAFQGPGSGFFEFLDHCGPPPFPGAQPGPGCVVVLQDSIGALGSDGQRLYAGVKGTEGRQGQWFTVDPDDPNEQARAEEVVEFEGQLPFVPGFESFEVSDFSGAPEDRKLLTSGSTIDPSNPADTVVRFDRNTGAMFRENPDQNPTGQFVLTGQDIKGMAYISSTRTLFIADDVSDKVFGTVLPENTGVELTVVGNYTTDLQVDVDSTTVQSATPASYSIDRNPEVIVEVQSPADGFVLTSPTTTISGRVNDPSIDEVAVGIQLPFTRSIDDPVSTAGSPAIWTPSDDGSGALWHITCEGDPGPRRFSSPPCAWRYGVQGVPGFDTGSRTQGSLETTDAVSASQDTRVGFKTAFGTEVVPDVDFKLVEVATIRTDLQGNDIPPTEADWRAVLQIVGLGGAFAPTPANAGPGFRFLELEPVFINPNMVSVDIDLGQFAGERVKIRFKFDSVNEFSNGGQGWFLDDIEVAGSGTRTVLIPTTRIDTGQGTAPRFFRQFSTPFELSEGENILTANAKQPYRPFDTGEAVSRGFVDTRAPELALFGIPFATNQLGQTLSGAVFDPTMTSLEITQTVFINAVSSTETIFGISAEPADNSFQVGIRLREGRNIFTASAIDGGGLRATTTFEVIGDITGPNIERVTAVFPVGAVSARAGDEIIFQVLADEGAGDVSGVEKVELVVAGELVDQLVPAGDIPEIVRAQFQLRGNFILFTRVPEGVPPGEFVLQVRATDFAGNTTDSTVSGDVTASLEAKNTFLFEDANLVGINLQSTGASPHFDIETVLAQPLHAFELADPFITPLRQNRAFATGTAGIIGTATVAVSRIANFQTGDRIWVGAFEGNTSATASAADVFQNLTSSIATLTANTPPNTTLISVEDTTGFAVGDTIVVGGKVGPFSQGFVGDFETTTITAITSAEGTIAVNPPLAENHFTGDQVTGIQFARVTSVVDNGDGTGALTIDGTLQVDPVGEVVVVEALKLGDVIEAIWFFEGGLSVGTGAGQGNFLQFSNTGAANTLTELKQGRAYWFLTKQGAFARATPLPGFLRGPIIPVRMQIDGVLFDPTGEPPSLPGTVLLDKPGWHQIALISEFALPVERGVRGVIFPVRQFTSLIEFQKFIEFDAAAFEGGEDSVTIVGGVFNPLFAGDIANPGDTMEVGRGFYIFMTEPGRHTP